MWNVVVFTEENNVAVVPKIWYIKESDECFWPPRKHKVEIAKLIKQKHLPGEDWKHYKARVLGTYDNYNEALTKSIKAQDKDILSSTDQERDGNNGKGKRKRAKDMKYVSERSSDNTGPEYDGGKSDSDEPLSYPSTISVLSFDGTMQKSSSFDGMKKFRFDKEKYYKESESSETGKKTTLVRTLSRSLSPDLLRTEQILQKKKRHSEVGLVSDATKTVVRSQQTSKENHLFISSPIVATTSSSLNNDDFDKVLTFLKNMQADHSEFRQQVFRKLTLINIKLNDVTTIIDNFSKSSGTEPLISEENEDIKKIQDMFPIMNKEKLNSVEEYLITEKNKKLLARELSRIGGSDTKEIVKRIMYKIFSNELGNFFSWDGAKGKQKFKSLHLANVIFDAIRLNKTTSEATDADAIFFIKKWLVRCKDRMQNKKRFNEAQQAAALNEGEELQTRNDH